MESHEALNRWRRVAAEGLPDERWVLSRSKAITSKYAQLYFEAPGLFKWAGMAAFASYQVALALAPFNFVVSDDDRVVRLLGRVSQRDYARHREDLDLIRRTNNAAFEDAAWAHYAFLAPDGGIEAIRAAASAHPHGKEMVGAFEKIAVGQRLLASPDRPIDRAERAIWQGNARLLKHEQRDIIQPAFDQLSALSRHVMRLTTVMDFHGRRVPWSFRRSTSFYLYMWTSGLAHLVRTHSVPRVARFEHRWAWIENRVLPMWKRLERDDLSMERRLTNLVLQGGYEAKVS